MWRRGTNGYSIWIGGIYEINSGKVLCHVMAGGKLIATFEPQCGGRACQALLATLCLCVDKLKAETALPLRPSQISDGIGGRGRLTCRAQEMDDIA